jgi:hypothetical protein
LFGWQSGGLRSAQETARSEGIRQNPLGSLAVFYVEQVALNRHELFVAGFIDGPFSFVKHFSTIVTTLCDSIVYSRAFRARTRQASVWRFDALVAVFFLVLVAAIVIGSAKQWWQLIRGSKRIVLHENEFVPITPGQLAQF